MNKAKGSILVMASAAIFGFTPVLGRLSYDGGNNSVMLTFLRSFLALPVLYILLKREGVSLHISKWQIRDIIILGFFGSALTTCTLYMSYNYIPVGMATIIHFIYPSLVMISCIVLFREKASFVKIVALFLSTVGVILFCDTTNGGEIAGILLALFSAVSFAFVMIFQVQSRLIEMNPFKLSFYQCCVVSTVMLFWGLVTGKFTLVLTPVAWGYTLVVAISVSVVALSLLQVGLKYVGASTASILSMLEPITSIVSGYTILREFIPPIKVLGSILILIAVALITLSKEERRKQDH
jgi:drug/metabolite transporter (DMT)-like permease